MEATSRDRAAGVTEPPPAVEYFAAGESASELKTGYVVLTHGAGWTSKMIRFGQRLRFRGPRWKYARWNHAALVLDAEGNLGEALSAGVVRTKLSKYEGTDYHLVRTQCAQADRDQIAEFAVAVLDAPQRTKYGWFTIFSLFFTLAFGSTIMFGKIGTAICSGFVSEALVRTGAILPRPPAYMMPADLAEYFSVDTQ